MPSCGRRNPSLNEGKVVALGVVAVDAVDPEAGEDDGPRSCPVPIAPVSPVPVPDPAIGSVPDLTLAPGAEANGVWGCDGVEVFESVETDDWPPEDFLLRGLLSPSDGSRFL